MPTGDRGSGIGASNPAPGTRHPVPGIILSRDGNRAIRVGDIEDVALPFYEGGMVGQFDFSQKGRVSGKGRAAVWRENPWTEKVIEPQLIIGLGDPDAVHLKKHLDRFKWSCCKGGIRSRMGKS